MLLCYLIYLHQRYDQWDNKYKSENNKIDITRSIISMNGKDDTAYGSFVVRRGVFTWRLRIISSSSAYGHSCRPCIGIIENNDEYLKEFRFDIDWDDYGYKLCVGDGDYIHIL